MCAPGLWFCALPRQSRERPRAFPLLINHTKLSSASASSDDCRGMEAKGFRNPRSCVPLFADLMMIFAAGSFSSSSCQAGSGWTAIKRLLCSIKREFRRWPFHSRGRPRTGSVGTAVCSGQFRFAQGLLAKVTSGWRVWQDHPVKNRVSSIPGRSIQDLWGWR